MNEGMLNMKVILLNGPSSAGKSTIAHALKAKLDCTKKSIIISLDDYLTMTADEPIWEDDVYAVMPRMCRDIVRALAANQLVIVDHVITSQRIYKALMNVIGSVECLQVLITCDMETLRQREKNRGNRCAGSAESSMRYLYPKEGYQITADSGKSSPDQIVKEIMMCLQQNPEGEAMFDLNAYLQDLMSACRSAFENRLLYMGLQGSYMRGEAGENSDIDIMIILDRFSVKDMDVYRDILVRTGYSEKSCGFICGRDEMARWNPLEVCQLLHTTKDLLGSLTDYLPRADRKDEINYVKLSLGNLYHEICHRYIHADRANNTAKLQNTCKELFFLLQNMHYLESGEFIITKKELKERVSAEDREMLNLAELPDEYDFDSAFAALFSWCQKAFIRMENI